MKTFLNIISVLVAVAVIIMAGMLYLTSGFTRTAEQFFSSVKKNDMQAASTYLSEDFLASISKEKLESFLKSNSLDNYKSASWNNRSITVKAVKINGSIKTADGGAVPLSIEFIKENGEWKILSIRKVVTGITPQEVPQEDKQTVPDDDALRQMTDASFREFALAVNKKDFTDFYNNLSELWKSQITLEKLKDTFKPFIDSNIDLTIVKDHTPVFSKKPEIGGDGDLRLEGYYLTKPSTIYFKLTFLYEYPVWKLAGISVQY